jgi:hypothetical protein
MMLIRKAWRDPEFRRQIADDPKGVVETQLCRKLPDEVRIFVHLEDAKTIHFSLPPMPSEAEVLPDEELEPPSAAGQIWEHFLSGVVGGMTISITTNPW